jgi:hypothetical protein
MNLLFPIILCFLSGPLPSARAEEKTPIEVDFAPLPVGQTEFALYFDFHSKGDSSLSGVSLIEDKTVAEIRDRFLKDLKEAGWLVKVDGTSKLIVYGLKDDPIKKAEFKVDTFEFKPKGNVTPSVRRVKKG